MSPEQPSQVPAGWYPDPHGVAELRWWDGSDWTNSVHPPALPTAPPPPVAVPFTEPVAPVTSEEIPAAAETVTEALPHPNSGAAALDFPPPSMIHPVGEQSSNGAPAADLDATPPALVEPQDQPLPSRRELREHGGMQADATPAASASNTAPDQAAPLVSEPTAAELPFAGLLPSASPDAAMPAEPVSETAVPSAFDWITDNSPAAPPGPTVSPGAPSQLPTPPSTGFPVSDSVWNSQPAEAVPAPAPLNSVRQGNPPITTSTTSGWLIALMPLIAGAFTVGAVKGAENYPRYVPEGIVWWMLAGAVVVLLYLVTLLLAAADRRGLDGAGHVYPAHWTWALLTAPVYLLFRTISVKRETGRNSVLLWVWLFLALAIVGGYFVTNYLAPDVLAAYTLPFL